MDSLLLTIKIGIDPEIGRIGGLLLTWHGVFIALAIGLGRLARRLVRPPRRLHGG